MKLNPFLYKEQDNTVDLYIGGCETIDAIRLFDISELLSVESLGATSYKGFGWATETDIPVIKTVGELICFLEIEDDIGIIDFEAHIGDIVKLSSHDDGECNFRFKSKSACISILKSLLPQQYVNMFINKLINNQGIYLELLEDGVVMKYSDFDDYIAK